MAADNLRKSDAAWLRLRARTDNGKNARRGNNPRAYKLTRKSNSKGKV